MLCFICAWQTFIDKNTTHMFCLDSLVVAACLETEKTKAECLWGKMGRPFHPTAKSVKDMQCRYFVIPFNITRSLDAVHLRQMELDPLRRPTPTASTPLQPPLLDFLAQLSNDPGKKVHVLPLHTVK